jgi:hypothetical protein
VNTTAGTVRAGARRLPFAVVAVAMAAPVAIAAVIALNANSHHTPKVQTLPPATGTAASGLRQAATAMEATAGYRFAGTVQSGPETVTVTGEFAAPNRLHETLTATGGQPVERLLIGSQQYQRVGTAWRAVTGTAPTDPRTTFGALAAATAVTSQPGGYAFTLAGTAAQQLVSGADVVGTTVTGTVQVQNGAIVDLMYKSSGSPATSVHFAYASVGTAPVITAPASSPASTPVTTAAPSSH